MRFQRSAAEWLPMLSTMKPIRTWASRRVVIQPWIGMTRGFWKTQRYLDGYWSRFPNVWDHGDWAAVDGDGLWYILGRSDDTIKLAGKRLGPAEVESILDSHSIRPRSAPSERRIP
jgi:acetyl-CoA synthetase